MYIKIGTDKVPITGARLTPEPRFTGVTGLTVPISGIISLHSDNDFQLCEIDTAGYARQTLEGGVLTLTNAPEPAEPTEPSEPAEQVPDTEADLLETALDHEARLSALELLTGGEG